MARFVKVLSDVLRQQQHDNPSSVTEISINRIEFQKLQAETKLHIESYTNLITIQIVRCDLRTLDNFPILPSIKQVWNVSYRSIQGTLQILVKLRNLSYLDISSNIIKDPEQLSPLKRIKNLVVCYANNPFCRLEASTLKNKIQGFNLTVEKQPRDLTVKEKTEPEQEPQKPVIVEKKPMLDVLNDPFSQSDSQNQVNMTYLAELRPVRMGRIPPLAYEPEIQQSQSSQDVLPEDYTVEDPDIYNEISDQIGQYDEEDEEPSPLSPLSQPQN